MTRWTRASCIALLVGLTASPVSGLARDAIIHAKFGYDGVADCQNPAIQNLSVHVEGVGTLSIDRHASLDVTGVAMGIAVKKEHYEGTLGSRPVAVEDGSASLRVMGRSHLRAIRNYPNNRVIVDMYVTGKVCVLKIEHHLNPGKRQYTFSSPLGGLAYCSRPRTVKTSCEPI
jgi:hypothetical protein